MARFVSAYGRSDVVPVSGIGISSLCRCCHVYSAWQARWERPLLHPKLPSSAEFQDRPNLSLRGLFVARVFHLLASWSAQSWSCLLVGLLPDVPVTNKGCLREEIYLDRLTYCLGRGDSQSLRLCCKGRDPAIQF